MAKQKQMTINELIEKWGLPKSWCANLMGISRNSFGNKIHELNKYCYFKKEELGKITSALEEFSNDIKLLKTK